MGNWLTGFPPFTTSFKNLVESLAKVDANNDRQKLRAFKTMISEYRHFITRGDMTRSRELVNHFWAGIILQIPLFPVLWDLPILDRIR